VAAFVSQHLARDVARLILSFSPFFWPWQCLIQDASTSLKWIFLERCAPLCWKPEDISALVAGQFQAILEQGYGLRTSSSRNSCKYCKYCAELDYRWAWKPNKLGESWSPAGSRNR